LGWMKRFHKWRLGKDEGAGGAAESTTSQS